MPFFSGMAAVLQFVVPFATPLPPRLLIQVTCATPTLSALVPLRFTEDDAVEKLLLVVGDVMATEGGAISDDGAVVDSVTLNTSLPMLPAASRA